MSEHAPAEPGGLASLVGTRRVLITVGSGGVGKTTTAAALGLLAARADISTLVLTIDPARRLATALGLDDGLDGRQATPPPHKLARAGVSTDRFSARMLDPKQTFDQMVRRHAPDSEAVQALLGSEIYRQLSTRLAGSQEYAAMETLHQLYREARYPLLILDTPPAANALDFLEAPQKMVDAVESPAVALLISAYQKTGKLSMDVLGFGAAYVIKRLSRLTGSGFLNEIAGFLTELSGFLGGMQQRAARVQRLLRQDDLAFVLVTSPDSRAVDEAIDFADRLERAGMNLVAVVVNRVHPQAPRPPEQDELEAQLRRRFGSLADPPGLARLLRRSHRRMQTLAEGDRAEIQRLKEGCGEGPTFVEVPLFSEDIHDIDGLVKLAAFLE